MTLIWERLLPHFGKVMTSGKAGGLNYEPLKAVLKPLAT